MCALKDCAQSLFLLTAVSLLKQIISGVYCFLFCCLTAWFSEHSLAELLQWMWDINLKLVKIYTAQNKIGLTSISWSILSSAFTCLITWSAQHMKSVWNVAEYRQPTLLPPINECPHMDKMDQGKKYIWVLFYLSSIYLQVLDTYHLADWCFADLFLLLSQLTWRSSSMSQLNVESIYDSWRNRSGSCFQSHITFTVNCCDCHIWTEVFINQMPL